MPDSSMQAEHAPRRARLREARWAVIVLFFVNGAGGASWFVRIPDVQESLALSPGRLGIALLGAPAGSLIVAPIAAWFIDRYGSRVVARLGALAFCLTLSLPALAPNLATLTLALFVFGATGGMMDIAMNAQAVAVEERYERPVMSSFHGVYSLGAMTGALLGGVIATLGAAPVLHLLLAGLILVAATIVTSTYLLPVKAHNGAHRPLPARPNGLLITLGTVAFCVLLGEGAMSDWSAVYLRGVLGAEPWLASAGFALFSLTMATGRILGDRLALALGPPRLVRLGGLIAAIGLALAVVAQQALAAVIGFGLVGVGFATI